MEVAAVRTLDEAEVAVVDCFEEDVLQVQEDVLQDTV